MRTIELYIWTSVTGIKSVDISNGQWSEAAREFSPVSSHIDSFLQMNFFFQVNRCLKARWLSNLGKEYSIFPVDVLIQPVAINSSYK